MLGIIFCAIGALGHTTAWSVAALCFFAATMMIIRKNKSK